MSLTKFTAFALATSLASLSAQAGTFNSTFEQQVIDLVNQIRLDKNLGILGNDIRLHDAAIAHSIDMAETPCMQHDSCNGTVWSDRIWTYYPVPSGIGENIAAGYTTPTEVVTAWVNSPGHYANILEPSWQGIGVGYYFEASAPYGHYWTQDFGTLLPVPEADTYAMMLAGLGMVGFMARRRAPLR